ncbi:nuclear transport factor 2 family protein [Streptomyces sp. NPDC002520]
MPEPVPYDLYIRLRQLTEGWNTMPGWAGSSAVVAGYHSAELCLRLIEDALGDDRPAAFPHLRIEQFTELLTGNLQVLGELLTTLDTPPPAAARVSAPAGSPSPLWGRVLRRIGTDQARAAALSFVEAHRKAGFRTGLEQTIEAACRDLGISLALPAQDGPVLDYASVVAPAAVHALRSDDPKGPEDHLFATAHQITECWLHIAIHCLESATSSAAAGDWARGARMLRLAVRAVGRASAAGQILALMDLADYHPLRVRLRDGSGAQSMAVRVLMTRIRGAAQLLFQALEERGISLLQLLSRTGGDLSMHEYLRATKALAKSYQSFLFQHYLLVLDVLGTHTTGSLGFEVRKMAERAAQPVVAEFNDAHYDYVKYTNLRYAPLAGSLVLANERAIGWDPLPDLGEEPYACPVELMKERVGDYFRFLEERDPEGWTALFEEDGGRLYDLRGTRPFIGRARLRIFIDSMFSTFAEMRPAIDSVTFEGHTTLAEWTIRAVVYNGRKIEFSGREEFVFSRTGHIAQAVAHWDPDAVARELWPELGAPAVA